jgi:hypothetical protein
LEHIRKSHASERLEVRAEISKTVLANPSFPGANHRGENSSDHEPDKSMSADESLSRAQLYVFRTVGCLAKIICPARSRWKEDLRDIKSPAGLPRPWATVIRWEQGTELALASTRFGQMRPNQQ